MGTNVLRVQKTMLLLIQLLTDAWGNIFIAGSLQNGSMIFGTDSISNDTIVSTMFIAKFDSSGHIKWMRKSTGNTTVCMCVFSGG
jgi:hypothetical protein